jgi:hypothetical protein
MNKNDHENTEHWLQKAAGVPTAGGPEPDPHILEDAISALSKRKKHKILGAVYSLFSFRVPVYQAVLGAVLLLLGLIGILRITVKEGKTGAETGQSVMAVAEDFQPSEHLIKVGISCREDPLSQAF